MRKLITIAAATAALALGAPVQATTVLSDTFDSYALGTSVTSLGTTWTVTGPGDVDVIGDGYFDFLPNNGRYIDLGGSNGALGTLRSVQTFAAGNYVLSFSLAGTQRVAADTTLISLGNWSTSIALPTMAGFSTYSFSFATNGGQLSFGESLQSAPSFYTPGQLANTGNLLDNVVLSTAAVPEPSTWALMIAGFAVVGFGLRRRVVSAVALPA